MSKDPAFPFYPQDFIMGVALMPNEQVGIYIKLLCIQHQHGGLIDKASFNSMVGSFELIRSKFIETEDGFFNKRLIEEMIKRERKSTNLSLNAKKRWHMHANSMQLHCKSMQKHQIIDANAMPAEIHEIASDQELPNTANTTTQPKYISFNFDNIWSKYPKRVGRKAALKHFYASVKTEKDHDDIHLALENYLKSERVKENFIQNGSTWFNNWRDWIDYTELPCTRCKGKGKYTSPTGYEIVCDCPRGKNP